MKLPCLIKDMDFKTYLDDPAPEPSLNSGLVKSLLTTAPRRVWYDTPRLNPEAEVENKSTFDLGTAAHKLFTGEGEPIVVIDADAFRSKEAKQQRDDAYAAGKTPILVGNMPRVKRMAEEALDQFSQNPDIGELLRDPGLLREATILWQEDGVMHRCRPDFYHPELNVIIHYKTTAAAIGTSSELDKYATSMGWYLTASHYGAGAKALTGELPRQFFAVQEVAEPHLCKVAEADDICMAAGDMRRERAMMIWGRCLNSNTWPGYPRNTHRLSLPEWEERKLIEQKDAEEESGDILALGMHWQAPEGWKPGTWKEGK